MSIENATNKEVSRSRPIALGIMFVAGVVTTVLRVVPHPPNFSGVGALGLYGGGRLPAWQAYTLPLGVMILSDLCLWVLTGFDVKYSLGHLSRFYVYGSFMIYVLIGRWLCTKNSISAITLASTIGALQFFIVTNFCDWLFQPWQPYYDSLPEVFRYSRDLNGLMTCFAMALPFYQNELPTVDHPFMLFTDFRFSLAWTYLGDVVFTTIYVLIQVNLERFVGKNPAPVATMPPASPFGIKEGLPPMMSTGIKE